MSDTPVTTATTATTPAADDNCSNNCCANTDGRNVVNVCAPGNTLYIGCMPPCEPAAETAEDAADA